jgi:hypothetical protein
MLNSTDGYTATRGPTADERWAAWVAKGVEHDRRVKDRAIVAATVVLVVVTLWIAIVLFL